MFRRVSLTTITLMLMLSLILSACASQQTPAPTVAPPVSQPTTAPATQPAEAPSQPQQITFAIEHFSVIAGTTWSGAHDRAGKRLEAAYRNVKYIYR